MDMEVNAMDETLDPLDRVTMATWRASNILGWGAIALGSALVMHTMGDELARRFHRFNVFTMNGRPMPDFGTWQFLAPGYGYRAFIAILTGVLIGWIAGRKILKAPAWTATILTSAYVLISWLALETSYRVIYPTGNAADPSTRSAMPQHGLPSGKVEWSYSLLALFAVAVAPLVARLVAKRRNAQPVSPGTL
jgi:hypothetical protein